MEFHVLRELAQDRHQELHRVATSAANARRFREGVPAVDRRPLPLRLLDRLMGPR